MGYIETSYMPKPMLSDYGQNYDSTYNYSCDLAKWKQHCSDMRRASWHNACEYKRRHWGGKKLRFNRRKNNMAIDFSKFDKAMDLEGLANDVKEAEENGGGEFKEVPLGTYEVTITKLELTESKKGDPMVSVWFKILKGEYKGSMLFMNQVITQGFQIHIMDEFLRSLDSGIDIEWPGSYSAYAQLLLDVHEAIDGNLEYGIEYGEKKGFNTFKITEVFEVE